MIIERVKEVLPEWFTGHPLVEKIKEEKQEETLKKRKAVAKELRRIQDEMEVGFPELEATMESILRDFKEAEERVVSLRTEASQVRMDLWRRKTDLDGRKSAQERILFESCDPRIDEAIEFFRNAEADLRRPGRITRRGGHSEKNLIAWTKEVSEESNIEAIHEAMAYCRDAIKKLLARKLVPEFDQEAVEAIKRSIPSTEVYVEHSGVKPMPNDDPMVNPPCDYTIQKLLKKRI
jgi:hypothetical protein